MRCFCAAASRLGTKSSPSESFTTTLFPSCFDSIGAPREERRGPDLQSSLDGLREVFRAAERRVHPPRATCLDERHDVLEVPVVAERELRFFFQAEDGIRDYKVTGVQTCALPI